MKKDVVQLLAAYNMKVNQDMNVFLSKLTPTNGIISSVDITKAFLACKSLSLPTLTGSRDSQSSGISYFLTILHSLLILRWGCRIFFD